MDRWAAMELLGLERDEPLTHDRLRRAYLRRLKTCSPERDPEGFRRLRQAFEAAEPYARMRDAMAAAHEPSEIGPARPAPPVPPFAPAPDSPGAARDETRDDELERLMDAVLEGPPEHDEHDEHDEHGEDVAHEAAALDGAPAALPSLRAVTDEILALMQNNQVAFAIALRDRWNRSAVDDHRSVSGPVALRWALTRELLEIAPALTAPLRSALARAIATGRLSSANEAVRRYQADNPHHSRDLAPRIAKRAPSIYKVIGPLLLPRSGALDGRSSGGTSPLWSVWIVIAVISALARAGSCSDSRTNYEHFQSPPPPIQLDPATIERLGNRLRTTPTLDDNGLVPAQPPAPPATRR